MYKLRITFESKLNSPVVQIASEMHCLEHNRDKVKVEEGIRSLLLSKLA